MLTRQKILLRLLSDSGGIATRTRLVKLAFLLSKQGKSTGLQTFYEFLPYLYGPYSFTLDHELDCLVRSCMISSTSSGKLEITTAGCEVVQKKLESGLLHDIEQLKNTAGKLDQNSLVEMVYGEFPWFTINSANPTKKKVQKIKAKAANYTVGYQGYQVDGLLNVLLESGIEQLIDTRYNPVSRRYGFHKSTLSILCGKLGINYTHVPQAGVPSSWRQELETEQSYKVLFQRYEHEVLDCQCSLLDKLAMQMNEIPSVLLCREQDCHYCHRSRLAKRLATLNGLPIVELTANYARTAIDIWDTMHTKSTRYNHIGPLHRIKLEMTV